MKTLKSKLALMALTTILLIACLSFFAMPVAASAPDDPPNSSIFVDWGSLGGLVDIGINGGDEIIGWCVNEHVDVQVPKTYTGQVYDYFGVYLPDYLSSLPQNVLENTYYQPAIVINWQAIAYIINHKIGNTDDVQQAIWYFSDNHAGLSQNAATMVNNAVLYLNNHDGKYIFESGDVKPMVCYIPGKQVVFFEYDAPPTTPPLPEMPAGLLLGLGLVSLGGVGWIGYRKSRVKTA